MWQTPGQCLESSKSSVINRCYDLETPYINSYCNLKQNLKLYILTQEGKMLLSYQ